MAKFPHVDLSTGKIYNCKKGSKLWWHEKGHIEYNKTNLSGTVQITQNFALYFWMISVTLSTLNKYMLFLSIPTMLYYIGCDMFEEWWCNRYAKKFVP